MKTIFPFLMAFMLISTLLFSQTDQTTATKSTKTSQSTLCNDFYAGYGALSIFYFTGRMNHSSDYPTESLYDKKSTDPQSIGNFFVGYSRILNNVVSMGIMFGYQNFHYTETGKLAYNNNTPATVTADDALVTGIARVTFCYVNKPSLRMYSGIGIGITVDFGKAVENGETTTERKLWPGGELTLAGLRFGRAFGGFIEFGFGSYGILNAGLSYKFAD